MLYSGRLEEVLYLCSVRAISGLFGTETHLNCTVSLLAFSFVDSYVAAFFVFPL